MIKVFFSILIAVFEHMALAANRAKRTQNEEVSNRDTMIYFIINLLGAACFGTLIYELLTAIFG